MKNNPFASMKNNPFAPDPPVPPVPQIPGLRDYFAAEALGGLLRAGYSIEPCKFAAEAYRLADAMLEARAIIAEPGGHAT